MIRDVFKALVYLKYALDDDWCPDCGWDWGTRPEPCETCRLVLDAVESEGAIVNAEIAAKHEY